MIILDSMGHLYSDKSLAELYKFAVIDLKLKPDWNHYSNLFPHFDLTTARKKKEALSKGAIPVSARTDMSNRLTGNKSHYELCKIWTKEMIETCRSEGIIGAYISVGLLGQPIKRLDFKRLKQFL